MANNIPYLRLPRSTSSTSILSTLSLFVRVAFEESTYGRFRPEMIYASFNLLHSETILFVEERNGWFLVVNYGFRIIQKARR